MKMSVDVPARTGTERGIPRIVSAGQANASFFRFLPLLYRKIVSGM